MGADPPGIPPLTQKQRDESERRGYRIHAMEYGLDYYVTGRFATLTASRRSARTLRAPMPKIDRLIGVLFQASGMNPEFSLPRIRNDESAMKFYSLVRPTLFGQSKNAVARSEPNPRFLLIRAISGTVLIVGLAFAFVERAYAPQTLVTDSSIILPPWAGWAGYWASLIAALTYNLTDYAEWWRRRQ